MKETNKKLLIIIPAYNEAESIEGVIDSIIETISQSDIIIINDGSTDATSEIVRRHNIRIIDHPFNMGIGAAMQTGYRFALDHGYDMAVQLDADGQHLPCELNKLIVPICYGHADMVVGSRFFDRVQRYGTSTSRRVGSFLLSRVVSTLTGIKFTDVTSGFRAVNKGVMQLFERHYPEDYPEAEALIHIHKAGFRVTEVPVKMDPRRGGVSSITMPGSVYYMVKVITALYINSFRYSLQ